MNVHELTLQNYSAASGCPSACQPTLYLGTAGSYGNEQINVVLGEGWQGLTVKAVFQPCGVPAVVPNGGGVISVPWEATQSVVAYPNGRIVFEGVTDGRVLISTDIPYEVGSHSDTEGSNSQPPTPSEWEQFVNEVKGDADRAAQAATDAEAAAQDVKGTGTQAVTDIGNAKDSALDAIAKAGEEAAGSITADVQAAKDAAAAAAQSAKDAAAELPKVQQAGQTALDDIATERENSLTALEDEGDKQQSAVAGAGTAALEAIQQAGQTVTGEITQTGATQVGAVQSAGTTQVGLVNSAGQQQAENIAQAGSQQVQAVQTAGTAAVNTVNDARDEAVEEIETANAHSPQINSATGYWQTWDAETGQYVDTTTKAQGATPQLTIGTVTTLDPGEDATVTITGTAEAPVLNFGIPKGEQGDGSTSGSDLPATTAADSGKAPTVNAAGTGYELTGPYAPLSAAIIETAKGNLAVCEDSVEWGLQGMRVYGKSTQESTTGAQLFPINKAASANGLTVTHNEDGTINITGTPSAKYAIILSTRVTLQPGTYYLSSNGSTSAGQMTPQVIIERVDEPTRYVFDGSFIIKEGDNLEVSLAIQYQSAELTAVNLSNYFVMLNAGSTALPYEPYTGGKPSPSPEYPQEILSAGDEGGRVELVVTGGNICPTSEGSTNFMTKCVVVAGTQYTICAKQNVLAWFAIQIRDKGNNVIASVDINSYSAPTWMTSGYATFTAPKSGKVFINSFAVCEWAELAIYPGALNSRQYDAYQSQPLTFSTPDGLPGIPVDSGGNFVDADGQQWICNYRDYDAKKDIKAIEYIASYNDESVGDIWMSTTGQLTVGASVLYTLDTPIETPIPADELAAYRSLHTYDGTTVLAPDNALASLEVDYIVKLKAYIEKKLTAIEQKIQEVAAAQIDTQTGG